MSTNNGFINYIMEGFTLLLSPNQVCDTVIYFKFAGGVVNIRGVECFKKDKTYLGWVYPQNLSLETRRAMQKFIRSHPKRWVRAHR